MHFRDTALWDTSDRTEDQQQGCFCTLIICQVELEADCGCEEWEAEAILWFSYHLLFEDLNGGGTTHIL
jgi:hypothetical protein